MGGPHTQGGVRIREFFCLGTKLSKLLPSPDLTSASSSELQPSHLGGEKCAGLFTDTSCTTELCRSTLGAVPIPQNPTHEALLLKSSADFAGKEHLL